MSKALGKAIMKRYCLKNIYFKKQNNYSLRQYKKQKKYCSRLYEKGRKKFFNNVNPKFFSDSYNANIKLTDKDEIIQNDKKIVEILNNFFENAVFSLKVQWQVWVILKGVSSLGVKFTRNLLARYDK